MRQTSTRARWVLGATLLLVCYLFGVLLPVWVRAARYCFHNYDLGIYGQGLAALGFGNPNPWLSARQVHLFADHFDPILWLAKPLVLALGMPFGGLVAEGLWVGLSVAPLVWLYRQGRLSASVTLVLSAMLLFSLPVTNALNYPIHPTTWAVAPWMLLVASLMSGSTLGTFVGLVLLFSCKEEFPFVGIPLGAALLLRGRRSFGLGVLALSALWIVAAFVVRPILLGPTEPYAASLFQGLAKDPIGYFVDRIASENLWKMWGLLLAPLAPLTYWAARQRARPDWLYLLLLVPPLAIRFLGARWTLHYGAVLVAGVVGFFACWLGARKLPRWATTSALALLTMFALPNLRRGWRSLSPGWAVRFPPHCPATPARLDALEAALQHVRARPGPVLVQGNLVPHLVERADVFSVAGPVPSGAVFTTVLVEKPPSGDVWPTTQERFEELMAEWRSAPGVRVLRDDAHLFLAEGAFTSSR